MSNARDDREWLENSRGKRHRESVCSPSEEIGQMHFSTENYSTALEYFHKALKSPEIATYPDKFRLYLSISDCHRKKGNHVEAQRFLDMSRCVTDDSLTDEGLGRIEFREAYLMLARSEYDSALKVGFSAYRRLKHSQEHSEVADTQLLLANCYHRLGLMSEAEDFFMDALSSYRRVEDRIGIAYVYNNLGLLHKNACRWNRALASLSKSLEIAKTLGLTQHLIRVELNLGVVYAKLRRFPEAISAFSTAANTAERFGDHLRLTKSLNIMGRTYVQAGEPGKAEKMILRAQAMANEMGFTRECALADENLGEMMIARGRYNDALANLGNALRLARKTAPEGDIVAEVLRRIADAEYRLGRLDDALVHVEEGLDIAEKCGEYYEVGFFFRTRALCLNRMGELNRAMDAMRSSVAKFEEYGNPFEKARSQQAMSRLLVRAKDEASLLKAKHVLADSIVEYSKLDDARGQIVSHVLLASVERRLGNLDEALLAVYEADRLAEEDDSARFKRALHALRNRIEAQMSNATTTVIDQFAVLGDIQSGARSRDQLVKGLDSTLNLILEKLGADGGFVAIPGPNGKRLKVVAREALGAREAQSIVGWASEDDHLEAAGGRLITDLQNKPELELLRAKLKKPEGTLLLQSLGFDGEQLGVLGIHESSARNPLGQEAMHFVAAYSSLISLSIYELVRSERKGRSKAKPASKGFESIVTDNKDMIKLLNLSERVAHSDATVLLQGETGTGKGLIAYAVHLLSERRERKFIHVNCAALPEQLLESELFGHVRGAFTGAFADKDGLLHQAHGGTVFLDEIGKTSLAMQGKLLQFLDTGKVRRVGSNDLVPVDVRIICASKANLLQMVDEGRFLEDFFYRINDFPLVVPPLRDRQEDIPLLMEHYIDKLSREMGKTITAASDAFTERLLKYRWPGNVRELEKVIKRAVILADDGDTLDTEHLSAEVLADEPARGHTMAEEITTLRERIEKLEEKAILEALERNEWNKSRTASQLGISYPNLLSKIKRYNLH